MPYATLAVLAAILVIGFVLRRRAAVEKYVRVLADAIVGLRALAGAPSSRRPAPPDHAKLLQHAEHFATAAGELESLGCTILGDLEELKADGSSAGALRWFIDHSGTICGWFAVIASKTRPVPVMLIHSELTPLKFLLSQHGGAEAMFDRGRAHLQHWRAAQDSGRGWRRRMEGWIARCEDYSIPHSGPNCRRQVVTFIRGGCHGEFQFSGR